MTQPLAKDVAKVPARGRRHSMTVVTEARKMHDAGWGDVEIQRLFARDGIEVSLTSIGRWCDPDQARRSDANQQRWNAILASRRNVSLGPKHARPEFKQARLMALREVGLSCAAVAKVLNLDFDDAVTSRQVSWAEEAGRYPKDARSPQTAKEESAVGAGTTPETCLRTATIRGPKESPGATGIAPGMAPKESSSADAE